MGDEVTNGKPWYASKGVWGGIIAAVSPLVGLLLHYQIDPEVAADIAGLLACLGGILAAHGRIVAEGPIKR